MKKILVLAAALGAAMLPLSAMANRPGSWFIRAEAGDTKHDIDFREAGGKDDDNDTSFSLRGGYYYTPNFGFEFFYTDFGGYESDDVVVTFPDGSEQFGKGTVETAGIGAGIYAKKNFGQDDLGFYVSGRAGVIHAKTEFKGPGVDTDDSWNNAYAGVGVGYDFNPNFGLGLSYDYAQGKPDFYSAETKIKLQTLSLGLEYRF